MPEQGFGVDGVRGQRKVEMQQFKITFIMPIYRTAPYLKRAVDNLLAQDYDNKEIICVLDGPDRECESILRDYDNKIKVVKIKHAGVCAARNAGARVATGDILSFFSSDFQALPGMAAMWMNYLNDEAIDFVYGGYRLFTPQMDYFPSAPFDYYHLTCENYIDGGFPIKRRAYIEWDENCKSLNDWDWWLSVCEKGAKGKFIEEQSYIAEPPHAGGLSEDSAKNWKERVAYIKQKHGIPDRKILVISFMSKFHGKRTAQLLDADWREFTLHKPMDGYEVLYLIGAHPGGLPVYRQLFSQVGDDALKLVQWIGSDIQACITGQWMQTREMLHFANNDIEKIVLIPECDYTYQKLRLLGFGGMDTKKNGKVSLNISALPLDETQHPLLKLPSGSMTVAIYAPATNAELYYNDLMVDVASAMPDIEFKFFGDARRKGKTRWPNIEFMGYITDMPGFIKTCHLNLRITQWDGLPMSFGEFGLMGRRSILTVLVPQSYYLQNPGDKWLLKRKVIATIRMAEAEVTNSIGEVKDWQRQLSDYCHNIFARDKFKERIEGLCATHR